MALVSLPVSARSRPSTRRILFADDDPGMRTIVSINLEADGHDVTIVDNGDAAFLESVRLKPDLIVLDVMMPGRDGFAVLESLKQDPSTADIPVVMLTAKATDDDVWTGWKLGADYYMTKPFDPDELSRFVRQVLGPWT